MVDLSGVILIVVLIVAALGYTIWPLARLSPAAGAVSAAGRDIARLLTEREKVYQNIRDIEFDREMGKISDENYRQMIGPARGRGDGGASPLGRPGGERRHGLPASHRKGGRRCGGQTGSRRSRPGGRRPGGGGGRRCGRPPEDVDTLLEAEMLGRRKVLPPGERRETAASLAPSRPARARPAMTAGMESGQGSISAPPAAPGPRET